MSKTVFLIFLSVNIFCGIAGSPVASDDSNNNNSLLSVAVLFRHGDRTPLRETWPTDIYYQKGATLYPEGYGQLNNQGKKRHWSLGQYFRQRYNTFLPSYYNASDILVKSTDYDRTLMSAECNLAGLYPPSGEQLWKTDLLWQPIPIHTTEVSEDPILSASAPCPKYDALYDYIKQLPAYEYINEEHAELLTNLTKLMGTPITSFTKADWIHSQISIYQSYGLETPSWVDTYWKEITALAALSFQMPTQTQELARLRQGPFFNYLLSYFDAVVAKTRSTKFLMLSAHDTTVADTLNSMQVYNDVPPEFGAAIIWELWQNNDSGEVYLNVYSKNSTHLEKLTPFGCQFDCNYEAFKSIAEPVPVDLATWRKECQGV